MQASEETKQMHDLLVTDQPDNAEYDGPERFAATLKNYPATKPHWIFETNSTAVEPPKDA